MNPFEGCRQRIERAQLHSNTAADIWNNSLPYSGYRPLVYMHDDGTGSIYIEAIDSGLMTSISLEFGELFYQLRAALDGVIYESAILQSGNTAPPNERALQFPICTGAVEFKKAARNIAPLSNECRAFIEAVQPYNIPEITNASDVVLNINRTLEILGDLARKDRHRRLHAVSILPLSAQPKFRVPDGMSIAYVNFVHGQVVEDQSEIATFKVEGWKRGANLQVNPDLFFDIAIAEAPPPVACTDTLSARIRMMLEVTTWIVDWFQAYFKV